MKNKGKHQHRFKENPDERRFAEYWDLLNQDNRGTLAYLLGDGNQPVTLGRRDVEVAATTIQWLGSPVGQNFLESLGFIKGEKKA